MPLPDEYLEYLQNNTNALERFGDSFTTVDQRIDYLVKQVELLKQGGISKEIKDTIGKLNDSMDIMLVELRKEKALLGETTQLNFRQVMAPLTGGVFAQNAPWAAVNTNITIHFPPGCNALVDVAIGHGDTQVYPRQDFIALDDATPTFPVYELIGDDEQIWVDIRNGDGIFPHTISVILTLQRRL